jgi:hypothetical protein
MKISEIASEQKQTQFIENLWKEGDTLFSLVGKELERNKKIWQNNPEWLSEVPRKRSKARDNRLWRAMEKVISTVSARPSKPNVENILSSEKGRELSNDLQDVFLQKYHDLGMKGKIRRALRYLFLSKFFCLKVVWLNDRDDFDVIVVDSRKVRVRKNSTGMHDTDFVIEEIEDALVSSLLEKFPKKRDEILVSVGVGTEKGAEEKIFVENMKASYFECWYGGEVIYKLKDKILEIEKHPYWDWKGMNLRTEEMTAIRRGDDEVRAVAAKAQKDRKPVKNEKTGEMKLARGLRQYLFNYFDRPIAPYVFGTMLTVGTQPVGETSLLDQVIPLQEEIDKRKRQISDNAEMMNGQYKIDTNFVKITKAEAQAAKADPRGIWYGPGVSRGVEVMQGKDMPATVFNEMGHSIAEVDNMMGALQSLTPEQMKGITATQRAIDREEAYASLDELIDLVDNVHLQIYSWWYQMMKVRYTEVHYVKIASLPKARRIVELMNSKMNEGVEIKIVPGQILPTNRIYRAERAFDELKAGVIDPLTYFEETERDNPMETAKRAAMYKVNPASILAFTEEEKAAMAGAGGEETAGGGAPDERAQAAAAFRRRVEAITSSEEFQNLEPEKQRAVLAEIRSRFGRFAETVER